MFGPFETWVHGEALPPLRTRKGRSLLALLTLRAGQTLARTLVAARLWPDSPSDLALANLRRSLTDLRAALGREGARLQSPEPDTLRLELTGGRADVIDFSEAVTRGDTASLGEAVALYRGPLLAGSIEEWLTSDRERYAQAYLAALEALASHALAHGNPETAAGYLRLAVTADPLRESAQRRLMEALATAGEHAAAKRVYRDLRLLLHRELDAEPDPETSASYGRIRALEQRQAAPPGRQAPPGKQAPPGFLPSADSSLVGRKAELRQIGANLNTTRLMTLTGEGGVGKTRLALRAAEERMPLHPGGVWFVDLAPLADPGLVAHNVAAALGIREDPVRPLVDTLVRELASRSVLLVLDNCEHLLDACARLVQALLRGCREIRVLATSRQPLGVPGEVTLRLPSLGSPPPDWTPADDPDLCGILARYDAVRLFVERAAVARPSWQPDRVNIRTVAQICRRLDGNPLAIELASARVRVLPVEQILARLDDRFRLLTGGSRAGVRRQQTLQHTLDWSYDLLPEPERRLLRLLSVFARGCTLEAAEAVWTDCGIRIADCGLTREHQVSQANTADPDSQIRNPQSAIPNEEVLDLLTGLVDKSLVVYEEERGAGRYRLLETVRQYGCERLWESGEAAAAQERHWAYFLALAEAIEPALRGPAQAAGLEQLEREHENLRGALDAALSGRFAAAAGNLTPSGAALRLGAALWRFWMMRGQLEPGQKQLKRALLLAKKTSEPPSPAAFAGAHLGMGSLALSQADYGTAQAHSEESLAHYRKLGDLAGAAGCLNNLASIARCLGDYPLASSLYAESRALSQQLEEPWGIAASVEGLAVVHYFQADYPTARKHCQAALAARRSMGDQRGVSRSLGTLGNIARRQGDYRAAQQCFGEGVAVCRELGDQDQLAQLLSGLADLARLQGDYDSATRMLTEALSLRQALGDVCGVANARHELGLVTLCRGDYSRAASLIEESLVAYQALEDNRGIAWAILNLGEIALHRADWNTARCLFQESLVRRDELGDRAGIVECLEGMAALASAVQQPERTARLLGAAAAIRDALGILLPPREQAGHDSQVAACQALGERGSAAWQAGRAMTLEQAVACALDDGPEPQIPRP